MNECPDGTGSSTFSLQRKSVFENSNDNERKDVSYEVWGNKTKFYYDALGRRTQADPNTRRYLFEAPGRGNFNSYDMEIKNDLGGISGISSSINCYKDANGKYICENDSKLPILRKDAGNICGKIGVDYGIIEADSSMTGGITCTLIEPNFTANSLTYEKVIGTCADGSRNLQVTFNFAFTTKLTLNKPFSVPEGYKFPNGYTATKEDAKAMNYHELGHVKYNSCVEFPKTTLSFSECICESKAEERLKKERIELVEKTLNAHNKLIDNMTVLFHNKYGNLGYAATYECPK